MSLSMPAQETGSDTHRRGERFPRHRILEPVEMSARREAYYRFVRERASAFFTPDGDYQPLVEDDRRITYWILPALLAGDDPLVRELALRLYEKDPCWDHWNIFTTSSIAAVLVRERERLTPALVQRSEEHLARFVRVNDGREPCSGANDYMFHGANDNMPAMATRALLFAGDVLGRRDFTEHGLFFLEGLCAHFQRRGLLAEYNSSTYSPITVVCLMDIAELCLSPDAREMAVACANRALLDLLAHWHPEMGAPSGSSSRCYLQDYTVTLTSQNALMWYLGFPNTIDPIRALSGEYDGPLHHGPGPAFLTAQFVECFIPDFHCVSPDVKAFATQVRSYPYEMRATMDSLKTASIQTRLWQQKTWSLGTASAEMWVGQSGHHATLRAGILRAPDASDWRNRVALWHYVAEGSVDWGTVVPAYHGLATPTTALDDCGQYHTAQKRGSALVVGHPGTRLIGKTVDRLRFVLIAGTFGRDPDEIYLNQQPLSSWAGDSTAQDWHFLRFGPGFVGIRAAGCSRDTSLPVRRTQSDDYLRIEVPVVPERGLEVTADLRRWTDWAYVLEIASEEEISFSDFRRECLASTLECVHVFYRNTRYTGRHGELHIVDSIDPEGVRFLAVDGEIESACAFSASGLPEEVARLERDGRRFRSSRLLFNFDVPGSPFYKTHRHVLARDTQPN